MFYGIGVPSRVAMAAAMRLMASVVLRGDVLPQVSAPELAWNPKGPSEA